MSQPLAGGPSFSLANRALRVVWMACWLVFARFTPPPYAETLPPGVADTPQAHEDWARIQTVQWYHTLDLGNGLRADMISSSLAPLFGSFTQSAFAQNVGLVAVTGVKSRYVVATAGLILVPLGLLPVMGRLIAAVPTAVLGGAGVVLFGTAIAYYILARLLVRLHGEQSPLARAIGNDTKGRFSLVVYATAVPLALFAPVAACLLYTAVAVIWLVPDRRIERGLAHSADVDHHHD